MNIEHAVAAMVELGKCHDTEYAHGAADDILCSVVRQYVGTRGDDLAKAFETMPKWYA